MSGSKKTTTATTVDPATVAQQQKLYSAANTQAAIGGAGVNPYTDQAAATYDQAAGATNLGLSAMTGDPGAMQRFMNPYQSQVMGAMNAQYDHEGAVNQQGVMSGATQAGAFGGSRMAVAQGVQGANDNLNRNAQIGNMLQSGYANAQNVAGQVANFGMGANNHLANMGDYLRNIQLQNQGYRADTIRTNMVPTGQTNTVTTPTNKLTGIVGGGLAGFAATKSPWGAAAGAVGGLFG